MSKILKQRAGYFGKRRLKLILVGSVNLACNPKQNEQSSKLPLRKLFILISGTVRTVPISATAIT